MKYHFISNVRVLAMLMVVFYHCLCAYTPLWNMNGIESVDEFYVVAKFLDSFSMPLFFCISGFLYMKGLRQKGIANAKFVISKTRRLFVPLVVWGLFICAFLTQDSVFHFFAYGASHLWFCGTLFLMFAIVFVGNHWPNRTKLWLDILLLVAFFCISCFSLKIPYNPGLIGYKVLVYFYVFWLGIFLAKYEIHSQKIFPWMAGFCVAVVFLLSAKSGIPFHRYLNKFFVGVFLVAFFPWGLAKWNVRQVFPKAFDEFSMGVYIIHHIVLACLLKFDVFVELFNKCVFLPFLLFPVIFALSLVLAMFLKKIPAVNRVIGW